MDDFNVEDFLHKIKAQITSDNPDVTEEQADKAARQILEGFVKAGSKGSDFSGIIGGADGSTMCMGASPFALYDDVPNGKYELPDGSVLQVGPPIEKPLEISPETREKLDKILAEVDKQLPPTETVRLKLSRGKTTVFDSKMGGKPYFPKEIEYPTVREGENAGKPLYFLAQLNFGKLPELPNFPSEGILQFFAGCEGDNVYGANFDDWTNQNAFRVIYHETVSEDAPQGETPHFEFDEEFFPFKGEFRLTAEKPSQMPVTCCDFRYEKAVLSVYNKLFGGNVTIMFGKGGLCQIDEPLFDALMETRELNGTRMGGYPYFTQDDSRGLSRTDGKKDAYSGHTVLLFQSDSENGGDPANWKDDVCWGDAGVANFFITPEDLAKRDFSNVLYTWDCS